MALFFQLDPRDWTNARFVVFAAGVPEVNVQDAQIEGADAKHSVRDIHHVELFVENHLRAASFYQSVLGFRILASGRSDAAGGDRSSVVLGAGDIRLILTAPNNARSTVAAHIRRHGEGIGDIALSVAGVERVFETAVAAGAEPLHKVSEAGDDHGVVRFARIGSCGSLVHSLIDADRYHGCFLPEYSPAAEDEPRPGTALQRIDHVALALEHGQLDRWTDFYVRTLGFRETHQEQVSTEYSAMRSKVVESAGGGVRFPMMEPAAGRRKSQIENFVTAHEGPGAQHLAFLSSDIVASVGAMKQHGIEFLATPATYYDGLENRVGQLPARLNDLMASGILADRDEAGLLLQIFTKPIGARPTLFLELIQRFGATGFGSGNIKALFEAVERAQAAGAGV